MNRLKIKNLELGNNLIAAPLAGFSDIAWRVLVKSFGAGLVFSEMVSVEGIWRHHKKTLGYIDNSEEARPFGLQLFGHDPESFKKAIDFISRHCEPRRSRDNGSPLSSLNNWKFDLIDINMGCPVKKVIKRGAGAALMKEPKVAEAIIKTVRKSYRGPLTVKFRSGWSEDSISAVEIAKIAEDFGADAVTIHPRTWKQGFKGGADWNIIKNVKKAVKIPVIGSGDVVDKTSAKKNGR